MQGEIKEKVDTEDEYQSESQQQNIEPLYQLSSGGGWSLYLVINDDYLFSAGDDTKIRVFNKNKKFLEVEVFSGHQDSVNILTFADGLLYSGSFDHNIRSWDLKEMVFRIHERNMMLREEIISRKYEIYYVTLYGKKKKKKKKSKKNKTEVKKKAKSKSKSKSKAKKKKK